MTSRRAAARLKRERMPAGLLYGWFAFVMATGIVSIATQLTGFAWISAVLFGVNLVVFPALWAFLAARLLRDPASVIADLRDHRRAPAMLTIVAATCVLANEVALTSGHAALVAGLWVGAVALWVGLVYCLFALMTVQPEKPSLESGLDGTWLLVVVATEALAILTTRAPDIVAAPAAAVFASLCLFLLGAAFYVVLLMLIVYRWCFLPMRPDQLTPAYWINMGAAAITTLSGTRLLSAIGAAAVLSPIRGFVFAATILFWALATWWIPLLAVLTVWRHRRGAVRLAYRIDNWAIVFPLGMYTTATWHLGHEAGLSFLDGVPQVFVWVALAAWLLTFFGMLRAAVRAGTGGAAAP